MDDLNEKAARRRKISHAVEIAILIILFICFIFPFILVIINVFKTKADITTNPLALIGEHGFTLENFPEAMRKMNFWRSFGNSACITIFSTIFTILLASMTAFVIVRNKWKACGALFGLMIASMVIPFQVLMVPLVSLYGGVLDILNHRATLIFMHVGFSLSMATFMFHGAIFTNVPIALEEAATIDAMAFWNDYLLPSLGLAKKELYTIPIATQVFYGTYSTDIGLVMAALLLAMLPILILYMFLQRYIVEGVTSGAVK